MDKPMPDLYFRLMSVLFKIRDLVRPRTEILKEVEIEPGFHVLDYACGPGSYSVIAAEMVGPAGKVYALDIHPLAIRSVQNVASKRELTNIETIRSDRETGLEDGAVDVAFLYDILHDLGDPNGVLQELHRVLKPDGILSCSDHHMKEDEIISAVTDSRLFRLSKKGSRTYSFMKEEQPANAANSH